MVNSFLPVERVCAHRDGTGIEWIGEWGVPSPSSSCPMSTRPDLWNHLSKGTVTSLSFLGGKLCVHVAIRNAVSSNLDLNSLLPEGISIYFPRFPASPMR